MKLGPDDLQPTPQGSSPAPENDPALEEALRLALTPVDAPFGFADRVIARALAGNAPAAITPGPLPVAAKPKRAAENLLLWPQHRSWMAGAVAAGLVAGVLGSSIAVHHLHEHERRVQEATRQFQTTERVTGRALAQARTQLERAGVPLDIE